MFGDQLYFISIPILAIIIYLVFRNVRIALRLTLALIVASLINLLLKGFIERPRPKGEHLVEVATYSFPSGHTVSSVVFYGFLIYIFWRSNIKRSFKITLTVLLSMVILSIGLSRIYLGVHYTTDVIAGYLALTFFLMIFILAFYITDFIKNNHSSGIKN